MKPSRWNHMLPSNFIEARKLIDRRAKKIVAMHIHQRILKPLSAIFLDAGSACEAIAIEMANDDKHFTVMTNNMLAVAAFKCNRRIRIEITGGSYDVEDEALVGKAATFEEHDFSVRSAIIGVSGLTATHAYNHGIYGETEAKRC